MLARILGILFIVSLILASIWLYLVTPSAYEKEADLALQNKDYLKASMLYTRALAEQRVGFSEERILYKLANSYRMQGERDRAFDFYFRILRLNPNSVYKDRIEELLKEQTDHLALVTKKADGSVDLSFLNNSSAKQSLAELMQQKNSLYLKLLNKILESSQSGLSYEALELYKSYKILSNSFLELKEERRSEMVLEFQKREMLNLGILSFPEDFGLAISNLSSNLMLKFTIKDNISDFFELSEEQLFDGIFIFMNAGSRQADAIQIPRLVDLYKNSKIFLLFVDESYNGVESSSEIDNFVSSLEQKELRYFVCKDKQDCLIEIRDLLNLRSLWQLNG